MQIATHYPFPYATGILSRISMWPVKYHPTNLIKILSPPNNLARSSFPTTCELERIVTCGVLPIYLFIKIASSSRNSRLKLSGPYSIIFLVAWSLETGDACSEHVPVGSGGDEIPIDRVVTNKQISCMSGEVFRPVSQAIPRCSRPISHLASYIWRAMYEPGQAGAETMIGENRQLVTDEPVEFEK